MVALGLLPDLEAAAALVKVEAVYKPDARHASLYDTNYAVFTELYKRLKDLM